MTIEWFKLHHDIVNDIKLRKFSANEKWAWIALLCLASQSEERGTIIADEEDLADYCEFNTPQDWLYYRDKLIAKGMIEIISLGKIKITDWEKQQHPDNPYGRPPLYEWRGLRQQVFKRDNYQCQYCGATGVKLQCDHIIPISRGGSNALDNLATACKSCNQSKHNKTLEEWLEGKS